MDQDDYFNAYQSDNNITHRGICLEFKMEAMCEIICDEKQLNVSKYLHRYI